MSSKLEKVTRSIASLDQTRGLHFLNKVDIFGFQPLPRHASEQSVFGAIFSIAVIVLMVFYIVSTTIRFFEFNPVITTALFSVQAGDQVQVGPGTSLDFAVVFRPAPAYNYTFYDERYFQFRMRMTTVNSEDRLPRSYVNVPFASCNFTSRWLLQGIDTGFMGETSFCPLDKYTLYGSYAQPAFSFFQIDVLLCNNATRPDCAPEAEIFDRIRAGRLNLLFIQQDLTPSSVEKLNHYETTFYLLKHDVLQFSELFFRKKTVDIQPDYVRRSSTIHDETLLFEREKSYLADIFDDRIYSLFLRFDTIINNQVWNVQTVFDLLGSWSAFFGTLAVTLGAIAVTYNTYTFYQRSPAWDEFDDHFQSQATSQLRPATTTSVSNLQNLN